MSKYCFQVGPEVGKGNGGLKNADCKEYNPPVAPACNKGWKYYDNEWKIDETLSVKCTGEE